MGTDSHPLYGAERFKPSELKRLRELVRAQFPGDDSLYLMHLERACRVVADGLVSVGELLDEVEAYCG